MANIMDLAIYVRRYVGKDQFVTLTWSMAKPIIQNVLIETKWAHMKNMIHTTGHINKFEDMKIYVNTTLGEVVVPLASVEKMEVHLPGEDIPPYARPYLVHYISQKGKTLAKE